MNKFFGYFQFELFGAFVVFKPRRFRTMRIFSLSRILLAVIVFDCIVVDCVNWQSYSLISLWSPRIGPGSVQLVIPIIAFRRLPPQHFSTLIRWTGSSSTYLIIYDQMMEIDSTTANEGYLPRVNGHMLNNYINKSVLILAELMSVSWCNWWSITMIGDHLVDHRVVDLLSLSEFLLIYLLLHRPLADR